MGNASVNPHRFSASWLRSIAPTRGEYQQGDVRSLWSAARKSLKNLGCSLAVEGTDVKLRQGEVTVSSSDKRAVRRLLNEARDASWLDQVLNAKDQGRVFHHASKHASSNSWIREGSFVSFADYRFAVKGRLNLLPTKVAVKRAGHPHIDTICPKCRSQPQTLGKCLHPQRRPNERASQYCIAALVQGSPRVGWGQVSGTEGAECPWGPTPGHGPVALRWKGDYRRRHYPL